MTESTRETTDEEDKSQAGVLGVVPTSNVRAPPRGLFLDPPSIEFNGIVVSGRAGIFDLPSRLPAFPSLQACSEPGLNESALRVGSPGR